MPEPSVPGSVLVIAERSDRFFGSPDAMAELLYLEGINDVDGAWLDEVDDRLLEGRSLVIVGPGDPDPAIADRLLAFVQGGGGMIAYAPGEAFAAQLGLTHTFKGVRDARAVLPMRGAPGVPLTLRGWSQLYTGEGNVIAELLNPDDAPAGSPALIELTRGAGKVIVFACDLTAAVYLTRQGDPSLAASRSSGFSRMRPADLFAEFGLRDAEHPVADLLCHLLREVVHRAWPADTVLPWLWYYPDNLPTVLLLTSDDDWATRDQFERLIDACDRHDARLTFYLTQPTVMDKGWFDQLDRRGYAFSLHPNIPPPVRPTWDKVLTEHTAYFRGLFGRAPARSVRNHAIVWSGYVEGPQIQARHGFTWDSNYFTFPPITRYYMTGGGLPMRFATPAGVVLPSFQLPSQFSDETTLRAGGYGFSLGLEPDGAFELITGLAKRNMTGQPNMMSFNSHPSSFSMYSSPLWEPVMAWAKQQGVPVWPVERFADFWEARRRVRLRPIRRGDAAPAGLPHGLVARLPS